MHMRNVVTSHYPLLPFLAWPSPPNLMSSPTELNYAWLHDHGSAVICWRVGSFSVDKEKEMIPLLQQPLTNRAQFLKERGGLRSPSSIHDRTVTGPVLSGLRNHSCSEVVRATVTLSRGLLGSTLPALRPLLRRSLSLEGGDSDVVLRAITLFSLLREESSLTFQSRLRFLTSHTLRLETLITCFLMVGRCTWCKRQKP